MTRRTARCIVLLSMGVVCSTGLNASGTHRVPATATIRYGPHTPIVGQPWHLTVTLKAADSLIRPGRRLRVIGQMTGHAMRPVDTELTRVNPEEYTGALAFTMRGSWVITVRAEDGNDVLAGSFPIEVVNDEPSSEMWDMRTTVDLVPPTRPNLVAPRTVVAASLGLTVLFQLVAAAAQRRRRGSRTASAPCDP